MSYRFIDHPADIAVEVKGKNLVELFTSSAMAWRDSAVEIKDNTAEDKREVNLSGKSIEILLVSFLNELNYLMQVKKWITSAVDKLVIQNGDTGWKLTAMLTGSNYSPENHSLKEEIKAVTFHQMKIENRDEEFITRIIFDI